MIKKTKKKRINNMNQKRKVLNKRKNKDDQINKIFNIKQALFNKSFKALLFNQFFDSAAG